MLIYGVWGMVAWVLKKNEVNVMDILTYVAHLDCVILKQRGTRQAGRRFGGI